LIIVIIFITLNRLGSNIATNYEYSDRRITGAVIITHRFFVTACIVKQAIGLPLRVYKHKMIMSELKTFLVKIKGFFKKGTPEQKISNRLHKQEILGLRFKMGTNGSGPFYTAYHPDSYYAFRAYPEFDDLYKKFTVQNAVNNGGDIPRLWSLILNCNQVLEEGIEGDFAELGVWRGNASAVLAHYAASAGRTMLLFDTFQGFSKTDLTGIDAEKEIAFDNTSITMVKKAVGNDNNCIYVKGFFPGTITDDHRERKYAVISLDCDLYAPTKAGLEFFYQRMPKGGIFFLHDYSSRHWNGSKLAIDEFCKETEEHIILMPDKSGSAFLRKSK
jgi:hypothetical protein